MSTRETLSLEEIIDFLSYLKTFIIDIDICSDNIEQIIVAQDKINMHPIKGFIGHYVYLAYSQCAINTYKLFHEGEKRSFFKLFNKIMNFAYSSELKQHLDANSKKNDDLLKNRDEFKKLALDLRKKIDEKKKLIDKIKERRLTFYAHSDPMKKEEPETLKEIKYLCEFAKELFNIFYGKFQGTTFYFNNNIATIENVLNDRKMVDDHWTLLEGNIIK